MDPGWGGFRCDAQTHRPEPRRFAGSGSVSTRQTAVASPARRRSRRTRLAGRVSSTSRTLDDASPGRPEAVPPRLSVQLFGGLLIEAVAQSELLDVPLVDPATEDRSGDGPNHDGQGTDDEEHERDHTSEDAEHASRPSIGRSPYPGAPLPGPHHDGTSKRPMSGALPLNAPPRTAPASIAGDEVRRR
jgi:hypothetical protein